MSRRQGFVRKVASRVAGRHGRPHPQHLRVLPASSGRSARAHVGAALARRIGPLLPAHRTALANLRAAFPENRAESDTGPRAQGLGQSRPHRRRISPSRACCSITIRTAPPGRVEVDGIDHFVSLRDDGKPGLIFSAHLANWELPAICAARFGLDATAVFRAPNDPADRPCGARGPQPDHGRARSRSPRGGLRDAGRAGAGRASRHADRPALHPGRSRGFHGPPGPGQSNPRQVRPPLRLPGPWGARDPRCRTTASGSSSPRALDLPRDPDGQINVQGAMQAMTSVVEGWVRDHPEQWLWMHRRWRQPLRPALKSS